MTTRGFIVVAIIATLGSTPTSTLADGGFFKHERRELKPGEVATGAVRSPKQEAILVTDGEMVQVILRTQYRAGPKELAWVVPVPAEPMDITAADDAVLDAMDQSTAPRFFVWHRAPKHGMGCGCGAAAPDAKSAKVEPGVQVHSRGQAGMFEYVVLSTKSGDALLTWLSDHHYHIPTTADKVADHYAKQGWYWLAMRLRSDAKEADTQAAHPISYVYRSKQLVFPMVISSVSADDENEVVLHVISDRRYASRNWLNALVERSEVRHATGTPSGTNYETILRDTTQRQGGHVFFTEYAMHWGDPERIAKLPEAMSPRVAEKVRRAPFVTRLRAVIAPGAMDKDVLLAPAEDASLRLDNEIYLSQSPREPGNATAQLAMIGGLFLAAGLCFGPARWRRNVRLCCAGAGLLLLATL